MMLTKVHCYRVARSQRKALSLTSPGIGNCLNPSFSSAQLNEYQVSPFIKLKMAKAIT